MIPGQGGRALEFDARLHKLADGGVLVRHSSNGRNRV